MKKIAIIGCTSFLAKKYISYFTNNKEFEMLLFGSKKEEVNAKFFKYSLPNFNLKFEEILTCDLIFYFSAAGVQANVKTETDLIYKVNAYEPIAISQYLDENNFNGKFITFGSYFEIGFNTENKFFSVNDVIHANGKVPNHYCNSKRLLTKYIHGNVHHINWLHFILPTIYGSTENELRLIPYLVNSIQNNTPIQVTSGSQIRQYIHVDDVVKLLAIITQSLSNESGIFNVSNSEFISIKSLIDLIFETLNFVPKDNVTIINREDTNMSYLAINATETEELFNWKATTSIYSGIKSYIK